MKNKPNYKFWIYFSLIYLFLSVIVSYSSLFGDWTYSIWGVQHCKNWDPDSAYLVSGLTFLRSRYVDWIGHPGHTLMVLTYLVAKIYYFFSTLTSSGITYDVFVAKNIYWVIFLTRTFVTVFHIISCFILYKLAIRILGDDLKAKVSVILYSLSYPFLLYINKISPESVLVTFSLLSVLFLWMFYENVEKFEKIGGKSIILLILSAFSCSLALCSKFFIAIPLPFILFAILLFQKQTPSNLSKMTLSRRLGFSAIFLVSSVLFALGVFYKLHWDNFIEFWFGFAPSEPSYNTQLAWHHNLISKTPYILGGLVKILPQFFSLKKYLPGLSTPSGLFFTASYLYILVSISGIVLFFKHKKMRHPYSFWCFILLLSLMPVYLYKFGWHYLFIQMALLSIFASYSIFKFADFISSTYRKHVVVVLIIVISGTGAVFAINSKYKDHEEYAKKWQPYFQALNSVDYGQKVYLLKAPDPDLAVGCMMRFISDRANFYAEYRNFFVSAGDNIVEMDRITKPYFLIEQKNENVEFKRVE